MIRAHSILALLAGPLLACASAGTMEETAAVADSSPTAAAVWVTAQGGKLAIDHFERCSPAAAEGAERSLEVLVHAEASESEISRDRFVDATARALVRQIDELADSRWPGIGPFECAEIAAPRTDVQYELSFVHNDGQLDVEVVDVVQRSAARQVSNRHSSDQCAKDSMGTVFCATSPEGVAVKSRLGQIACARGSCVQTTRGDWQCSRAAGGWAEVGSNGRPECQNGCYTPSGNQCRRVR